jgi:hypothetical protein
MQSVPVSPPPMTITFLPYTRELGRGGREGAEHDWTVSTRSSNARSQDLSFDGLLLSVSP